MNGLVLSAAALAALGAAIAAAGPARTRPAAARSPDRQVWPGGAARGSPVRAAGVAGAGDETEVSRWARPASALAGVAAWLLLGGWVGAGVGLLVAVGLPVWLARLEPASARRRRLALVKSAPIVADLLSAALSAGVPLERALPVVARAVGEPARAILLDVQRRSDLGEPAESAWAGVAGVPVLGGLAIAVARSSRTGAPLAALLSSAAEDLRSQANAAALVEVRATAVRSVLPLGLCLLPAFALLGIVPVVGGLVPTF